ncbi:amidophosphoribosyltransferase, partial [mine drainage metagenome]
NPAVGGGAPLKWRAAWVRSEVRSPTLMPAREFCGVVGVSLQGRGAAPYLFRGLRALQHRGQESAGIATSSHGSLHHRKGMGLVHEVFSQELIDSLRGSVGIGHVRYSTTGT